MTWEEGNACDITWDPMNGRAIFCFSCSYPQEKMPEIFWKARDSFGPERKIAGYLSVLWIRMQSSLPVRGTMAYISEKKHLPVHSGFPPCLNMMHSFLN